MSGAVPTYLTALIVTWCVLTIHSCIVQRLHTMHVFTLACRSQWPLADHTTPCLTHKTSHGRDMWRDIRDESRIFREPGHRNHVMLPYSLSYYISCDNVSALLLVRPNELSLLHSPDRRHVGRNQSVNACHPAKERQEIYMPQSPAP